MTITNTSYLTDRIDTFEVVESIPEGYQIWNIGDNMIDGYIPLAEVENYSVNINTLKAIKLDDKEVELLRAATSYGVHDLKAAKKALNRKNPKGYTTRKAKEMAEKTIAIFERIS